MHYTTPEEIIIKKISENRGTGNFISKDELIRLSVENDIEVNDKMAKRDIAEQLAQKIGYEQLAVTAGVGVSSAELQKKFGITNKEVKLMAAEGFLRITGKEPFRLYGRQCYANLYSPYDYFKSPEEVAQWLTEQQPVRKTKPKGR